MPDTYRVIVTGPRLWRWPRIIWLVLDEIRDEHPGCPLVIVHGQCDPRWPHGVRIPWESALRIAPAEQEYLLSADWHAGMWARASGPLVTEESHPADWGRHGRRAGFVRNEHMAALGAGECVVAQMPCRLAACERKPGHITHGTAHMAEHAESAGIPVRRISP